MTGTASRLRVGVQLPEVERRVPWAEYAAMAWAADPCVAVVGAIAASG